jgi:DNA polymerase III subunit gamma/tau
LQDGEPCGKCTACIEIDNDASIDVIEVDAASNAMVSDARALREAAMYKSTNLRYRAFILDEAHAMSKASFDTLLKILEETPPNIVFILCTTLITAIPDTIISRCMAFPFRRVSVDQTIERLKFICDNEGFSYELPALREIAVSTNGSMRDAISRLDQLSILLSENFTVEGTRQGLGVPSFTIIKNVLKNSLDKDPTNFWRSLEDIESFPDPLEIVARIEKTVHYAKLVGMSILDPSKIEIERSFVEEIVKHPNFSIDWANNAISKLIIAQNNFRQRSPLTLLRLKSDLSNLLRDPVIVKTTGEKAIYTENKTSQGRNPLISSVNSENTLSNFVTANETVVSDASPKGVDTSVPMSVENLASLFGGSVIVKR